MRHSFGRLLPLALIAVLGACGGGGSNPLPAPHGSSATPCPSGYVGTAPSCTPGAQGTLTPTSQATSAPLPSVGGFSGSIAVPAATGTASAITVDASTQAPAGTTALQSVVRANVKPASTSTFASMLYVWFTATNAETLNGLPGYTITVPSSLPLSGPVYVAEYESGKWMTVLGPATVSQQTITITPDNSTLSLSANTPVYFCVYVGSLDNVANPFPSATFTLSGSETSTSDVAGNAPTSTTMNITETLAASPQADGTIDLNEQETFVNTSNNHTYTYSGDNYYLPVVANGSVIAELAKTVGYPKVIYTYGSDNQPSNYQTTKVTETYNQPYPVDGVYPFATGTIAGANGNGYADTELATPQPGATNPTQGTQTSNETVNADGSYSSSSSTSGTASDFSESVVLNSDGSGYDDHKPVSGTEDKISFGLPASAGAAIPVTDPVNGNSTVPNWLPGGIMPKPLETTTLTNEGQVALPSGCSVSGVSQAWDLRKVTTSVDPILGDVYTDTNDEYLTDTQGEVCYTYTFSDTYYNNGNANAYNGNDGAVNFTFQQTRTMSLQTATAASSSARRVASLTPAVRAAFFAASQRADMAQLRLTARRYRQARDAVGNFR